MLQDGLGFISLYALGHHVVYVHDHCRPELQVVLRLDPLLGHGLCDALRVASFELASKEVAEPPLEKGDHASEEEEPDPPARSPEADTGPFADWSCVEAVVDEVLEVLGHPHLPHQSIFITVHPCQLAHVRKDVLEAVSELEGLDVAKAILNVRIYDQLGEAKDLSAKVEGIAEARLLSLLSCQSLDRFQIEVIVEMKVIEILPVNE